MGIRYKGGMGSGASMKRMQVDFSGWVQGVGFRYTVCRMAQSFKVTGIVRNLDNGDVGLVAEGCEQELADFLDGIRSSGLGSHIARATVRWSEASGEYEGFGIL
jgi:acylphosphatase